MHLPYPMGAVGNPGLRTGKQACPGHPADIIGAKPAIMKAEPMPLIARFCVDNRFLLRFLKKLLGASQHGRLTTMQIGTFRLVDAMPGLISIEMILRMLPKRLRRICTGLQMKRRQPFRILLMQDVQNFPVISHHLLRLETGIS